MESDLVAERRNLYCKAIDRSELERLIQRTVFVVPVYAFWKDSPRYFDTIDHWLLISNLR